MNKLKLLAFILALAAYGTPSIAQDEGEGSDGGMDAGNMDPAAFCADPSNLQPQTTDAPVMGGDDIQAAAEGGTCSEQINAAVSAYIASTSDFAGKVADGVGSVRNVVQVLGNKLNLPSDDQDAMKELASRYLGEKDTEGCGQSQKDTDEYAKCKTAKFFEPAEPGDKPNPFICQSDDDTAPLAALVQKNTEHQAKLAADNDKLTKLVNDVAAQGQKACAGISGGNMSPEQYGAKVGRELGEDAGRQIGEQLGDEMFGDDGQN